jgi:hypothetical protein
MNDRRFFDENGHDHVLVDFTSIFMYLYHLVNAHIAYHVPRDEYEVSRNDLLSVHLANRISKRFDCRGEKLCMYFKWRRWLGPF